MSLQVEKLEKNMAKLTIEVPAERFEEALQRVYLRQRNDITIPGFRRGKAPRRMIERMYGAGFFYEDAANDLIPEVYSEEAEACEEEIVSRPKIDIVQIGSGKPFIFTAEVALKPVVTLGAYRGIEVEKRSTEVTEEEIDAEVEKERENNSRLIDVDDRPVADGDVIKLDFEGFLDGEPFEGGSGENCELTIGSGDFIPGFEEQLVGAALEEEREVNVTFPEDYPSKELAGKDVTFRCKVHEIRVKELPELDDDFVMDVSEFETLEEYREDIRRNLRGKKEKQAATARENEVLDKIVQNASMEIPDPMVELQADSVAEDFAQNLRAQGMEVEQYLQYSGMTAEQYQDQLNEEARRRIRISLVLEEIAKEEDIQIPDEQLEEELRKMAEDYQVEPEELKESLDEEGIGQVRKDLALQAAVDLVRDAATETETEAET